MEYELKNKEVIGSYTTYNLIFENNDLVVRFPNDEDHHILAQNKINDFQENKIKEATKIWIETKIEEFAQLIYNKINNEQDVTIEALSQINTVINNQLSPLGILLDPINIKELYRLRLNESIEKVKNHISMMDMNQQTVSTILNSFNNIQSILSL